jgi:ATP-binding cassette subfamily F protein uup
VAHLLGAKDLCVEFPTQTVLNSVTVSLSDGDRIGIVGRNGEGKSTLIRALASRQKPDSGEVIGQKGLRVGLLDQSDTIPGDHTVKYAVVGDRPEHEWASDARVRDVITGLLSDVPWNAVVGDLSGGQSRRVSLAALLVGEWDVLILDEPTNHLDVLGVAWLAQHTETRWPRNTGALVVVTHDRWFLDAATRTTWEVHDGTVDVYDGGYAAYVLQKVERERSAAATEAKRQNLLRKELAWLRRGAPARTSKPKFRIDAANELISNVPDIRDPVSLAKLATTRLGKKVIDLNEVSVSFGAQEILHPLTWKLAPGERTGILGANGAGKSTLLGLLAGTIEPSTGHISRGSTVNLRVLDQRLASLDEVKNDRVSEVIARKKTTYKADGAELTPAQLLERLGFRSSHLSARVFELSGGQRRRLQFLLELLDEPNVLLLDEPTNDLDTEMLRAMEDLLDTWPGTLIVVSHDRYLLERITDQQYAIIDGEFRHLPGGIEEYLRLESSSQEKTLHQLAQVAESSDSTQQRQETETATLRPGSKEHREAEKEQARIENRLGTLSKQLVKLDQQLLETPHTDIDTLNELSAKRAAIAEEQENLEARWIELAEKLD